MCAEDAESCDRCPEDCGECPSCGDGRCTLDSGLETCSSCPEDCGACATCGDGACDADSGEDCVTCTSDCGACDGCGDATCDLAAGETCASCEIDCGACDPCGDEACDADAGETCSSCPADCGACEPCGDGECAARSRRATTPPRSSSWPTALVGWDPSCKLRQDQLTVELVDREPEDGFGQVSLYGPQKAVLGKHDCAGKHPCTATFTIDVTKKTHVVAFARQADGQRLVSAPIWFVPPS